MRFLLYAVVAAHLFVVLANAAAFFVLPFTCCFLEVPFWFSVLLVTPVESLIIFLSFNRQPCPLTQFENHLRERLGMKPIGGFIGHYLVKRKWRKGYAADRSLAARFRDGRGEEGSHEPARRPTHGVPS